MDAESGIRQLEAMRTGRVIAWGGYDKGKARVRLLLDALRRRRALAAEINIDVWRGVEDKSLVGPRRLFTAIVRLLIGYPGATFRLLRQPARSAVLLPYPGIPDIFFAALPAKIRRQPIVLDAFLPFHDTIVRDRALVGQTSLRARIIWAIEWLALRLANILLVDTDQHGQFFAEEFGIDRHRFVTVLVGAEPLFGAPPREATLPSLPTDRPLILFYGQLIPLHGLTTILEASRLAEDDPFHWVIVGKGQEEPLLRAELAGPGRGNITWIPWVDYAALPALIDRSALCLGIFGASNKAARVIPNKVFQALACGKSVITRSSPAMDPFANRFPETIVTVPAADPAALVAAVRRGVSELDSVRPMPVEALAGLGPDKGVDELLRRLASGETA